MWLDFLLADLNETSLYKNLSAFDFCSAGHQFVANLASELGNNL